MDYKVFLFGLAAVVVSSLVLTFIVEKCDVFGRRVLSVFALSGMLALVVWVPTWRLKLCFGLWFLLAIVGNLWREHRRRVNLVPKEVARAP